MAIQGLRSEESTTRLEAILALPVSRSRWFLAQLGVTTLVTAVMLLVIGWSIGVGAALVTRDWSLVLDLGWAQLSYLPAVGVVLAVAALLFGTLPRLVPATWALVALSVFLGSFGTLLDLPQFVLNLSPFTHLAEMPIEKFNAWAAMVLSGISLAGVGIGVLGLRRRDVSGG